MKKTALVFALATLLLPVRLLAFDASLGGTTLFRFEQRSAPGFDKERLIPATQYLDADLEKLGDGNRPVSTPLPIALTTRSIRIQRGWPMR